MSQACILPVRAGAEIHGLHDFFVQWFSGQAADFERCEQALHADFTMIPPDGKIRSRAETIALIRAARGSLAPGFRIEIEAVTPLWQCGDAILVAYVEAQHRDGRHTRRQSSALLVDNPAAPGALAWRHLHETWMPATESSQVPDKTKKRGS